MWKASLILILTIVISFYETSAQESDNSEKESGLRPTTASNKENNVNEAYTNLPVTSELPNMAQNIENKLTRVTYDQRQEGQYNIRADLDNFLIVLVPPNPSSGINLLDILTRSSLKRSSSNKGHKKHQLLKKTIPSGKGGYNSGYESRQHSQHNDGSQPSEHYEYIEGRTPYRVDISSENEFSKAHPYPQVEVLPPSHPLQSHLMKPYHLDADPGIMQKAALIPPEGEHPVVFDEPHTKRVVPLGEGRHKRAADNEIYESPTYFTITDNQPLSDFFGSINMYGVNEHQARTKDSQIDWELKLIGATEQCGPDRIRNTYGICQFTSHFK